MSSEIFVRHNMLLSVCSTKHCLKQKCKNIILCQCWKLSYLCFYLTSSKYSTAFSNQLPRSYLAWLLFEFFECIHNSLASLLGEFVGMLFLNLFHAFPFFLIRFISLFWVVLVVWSSRSRVAILANRWKEYWNSY